MKAKFMSTLVAAALALMLSLPSAQAQSTNTTDLIGSETGVIGGITAGLSEWLNNNEAARTATNWLVAPYFTYAPDIEAEDKVGGGIFVAYKVTDFLYAGIGVDYLGELTLPQGNVELKADIKPFKYLGFATNFIARPFAVAGIAVPLSGSGDDNGNVGSIIGAGVAIPVWKISDNYTMSVGGALLKWTGVGDYSGNHYQAFLSFHANTIRP